MGGSDNEEDAPDSKKNAELAGIGSKAEYETEEGGRVTTMISAFDNGENSDNEEMPGLIPLADLPRPSQVIPPKPKLRGNTTKLVPDLKSSKKRKGLDNKDRKGSHKKQKR